MLLAYDSARIKQSSVPHILFFSQVKLGDTLDLVLSENPETNTVTLMRVILRRVFTDPGNTEKHKVVIRRWKCLELPREEAFKP